MPTKTKQPMAKAETYESRYPSVIPTIVKGRQIWTLVVEKCPSCKGRTAHGGGLVTGKPLGGWRKAHCCGYQIYLAVE